MQNPFMPHQHERAKELSIQKRQMTVTSVVMGTKKNIKGETYHLAL